MTLTQQQCNDRILAIHTFFLILLIIPFPRCTSAAITRSYNQTRAPYLHPPLALRSWYGVDINAHGQRVCSDERKNGAERVCCGQLFCLRTNEERDSVRR
ncbi:hypothetical protein EVAR_102002_1 [Eumeta japonica]|uniref:Secreted protein n=1 Tax=Eumeta variegata TaxID=151549 RepID=A0A4C1SNM6_EUMVA|nr:hypothetical protein EVAR_102002_1 [Eumeta japonica]